MLDAGDCCPDRDGQIAGHDDDTTTSTELLASRLPGARAVKAFNTLHWGRLRDRGGPDAAEPRLAVFVAGDDRDALELTSRFVRGLGFAPAQSGGLADGGRRQQIGGPLAGAHALALLS